VKIETVDSCEKAFGVLTYKTARYHKLSGNPHTFYILIQLCFYLYQISNLLCQNPQQYQQFHPRKSVPGRNSMRLSICWLGKAYPRNLVQITRNCSYVDVTINFEDVSVIMALHIMEVQNDSHEVSINCVKKN
jgi:hypothetical protein